MITVWPVAFYDILDLVVCPFCDYLTVSDVHQLTDPTREWECWEYLVEDTGLVIEGVFCTSRGLSLLTIAHADEEGEHPVGMRIWDWEAGGYVDVGRFNEYLAIRVLARLVVENNKVTMP